jgi:hypothetical protein
MSWCPAAWPENWSRRELTAGTITAVEERWLDRWLAEGWSPWRFVAGGFTALATAIAVFAFIAAKHHPGVGWWLLLFALAGWAWTGAELVRWRIKYRRQIRELAEAQPGPAAVPGPGQEPASGLEVKIEDEHETARPGIGLILEIEFAVTNHDPVPHQLRVAMFVPGGGAYTDPPPGRSAHDPEVQDFRENYVRIRRHRERDALPRRVEASETVRGMYVADFRWNPNVFHHLPDYTLIVNDGRRRYEAHPHGADGGNGTEPEQLA